MLVDDVLYTGRTVRAAINELFDYGRPARDRARGAGRSRRPRAADRGRRTSARALAVARDLSIVLSRDADGRLALSVEPRESAADA